MEPKDYVVVAAVLIVSIVSFGISLWIQQRTKNTDRNIEENRRKEEQRFREEWRATEIPTQPFRARTSHPRNPD
jgi:hypothetical protein